MPGFDQTGPMGAGAMSGGGRGHCNPAMAGNIPAYAGGYGYGRGLGLRRGFRGGCGPGKGRGRAGGRGYGWVPPVAGPAYPMDAASEMDMLKADADYLKKSLEAIEKRIEELRGKPANVS
jgi:hypothetical protein